MNLFTRLQSLFSVSSPSHSTCPASKTTSRSHRQESLYGKSASAFTSELAQRGDGSMPKGVTRMNEKAYWQGRNAERNIGNGTAGNKSK